MYYDSAVSHPDKTDYSPQYLSDLHREAEETKAEIAAGKHPVYDSAEKMLRTIEEQ